MHLSDSAELEVARQALSEHEQVVKELEQVKAEKEVHSVMLALLDFSSSHINCYATSPGACH